MNTYTKNKLKIAGLVLAAVLVPLAYVLFIPHRLGNTPKIVNITTGMGVGKIASKLKEEGVIGSEFQFKLASYIHGRSLKAGDYELSPSMNNWTLISLLQSGKVKLQRLTVPEGYSAKQIAALIDGLKVADGKKLLRLVNDRDFAAKQKITGSVLEGYLYPETYMLNTVMKEEDILALMLSRFEKVMAKNDIMKLCDGKKVKFYDVLRLASIIEKEAGAADERPIVAAVFLNRLKKQMRLESCATVFYALGEKGKGKDHLLTVDLQTDSRYNTYKYYGLPPAPICNPGLSSILAALNPAEVKYLYFVSKNDGTHEFSETLEQHNRAKHKYKSTK